MRLPDTSAWIEFFAGSKLGVAVASIMPGPEECLVPTIVQYELAKWFARERSETEADGILAFTGTCVVLPLDTRLALAAADVARLHELSTADAIIYASALSVGAELVTCDAHFSGLPGVLYLAKRGD